MTMYGACYEYFFLYCYHGNAVKGPLTLWDVYMIVCVSYA